MDSSHQQLKHWNAFLQLEIINFLKRNLHEAGVEWICNLKVKKNDRQILI